MLAVSEETDDNPIFSLRLLIIADLPHGRSLGPTDRGFDPLAGHLQLLRTAEKALSRPDDHMYRLLSVGRRPGLSSEYRKILLRLASEGGYGDTRCFRRNRTNRNKQYRRLRAQQDSRGVRGQDLEDPSISTSQSVLCQLFLKPEAVTKRLD